MDVWGGLTGQRDAIAVLHDAASGREGALTHSWLITGPPGSGRSNLAFAFATALLSSNGPSRGEGQASTANAQHVDPHAHVDPDAQKVDTHAQHVEAVRRQVEARTHPDLAVLSTERVIITIDEVRKLVASSQYSPSAAPYRVMIIEDADRMTERTSNLLLKALEEPPERAIWILCAPSDADLLPTIRSRVRTVRLRVPSVDDVAELLRERNGIDADLAERAARQAQSHIGMAQRLATSDEARARRAETIEIALGIRSVSDAVFAAAKLLDIAGADAKAITEERDAEERAHMLRSLGVEPGAAVPAALRSQLKQLEEDQKRRATRSLRDGIDRILVDLLALYRDVLMLQLHTDMPLVNRELVARLTSLAEGSTPSATLAIMDSVSTARDRITANVAPALALEAMLVSVTRRGVEVDA